MQEQIPSIARGSKLAMSDNLGFVSVFDGAVSVVGLSVRFGSFCLLLLGLSVFECSRLTSFLGLSSLGLSLRVLMLCGCFGPFFTTLNTLVKFSF